MVRRVTLSIVCTAVGIAAGAVPVDQVPDALRRLVSNYRESRRPDEPFYLWARRTSPADLQSLLSGAVEAVSS